MCSFGRRKSNCHKNTVYCSIQNPRNYISCVGIKTDFTGWITNPSFWNASTVSWTFFLQAVYSYPNKKESSVCSLIWYGSILFNMGETFSFVLLVFDSSSSASSSESGRRRMSYLRLASVAVCVSEALVNCAKVSLRPLRITAMLFCEDLCTAPCKLWTWGSKPGVVILGVFLHSELIVDPIDMKKIEGRIRRFSSRKWSPC